MNEMLVLWVDGVQCTNHAGARAILSQRAKSIGMQRQYTKAYTALLLQEHGITSSLRLGGPRGDLLFPIAQIEQVPISPGQGTKGGLHQHPAEVREQVYRMAEVKGTTAADIAQAMGPHVMTIKRWLNALPEDRREAIRRKNPTILNPSTEVREQAYALADQGVRPGEIAQQLVVAQVTVEQWLRKRLRAMAEAKKKREQGTGKTRTKGTGTNANRGTKEKRHAQE